MGEVWGGSVCVPVVRGDSGESVKSAVERVVQGGNWDKERLAVSIWSCGSL